LAPRHGTLLGEEDSSPRFIAAVLIRGLDPFQQRVCAPLTESMTIPKLHCRLATEITHVYAEKHGSRVVIPPPEVDEQF